MLFSVLSRKDKVPRRNFSPLRSRFWLKNLRWWLPQEQVPRPCPAVTHWGSQVSRTQLAFRLLRPPKWRLPLPFDQGTGIGERFTAASRPGPRPVGALVSRWAQRGQDLSLTSLSTWRPPLPQPLAECHTNGRSLTVGCLWAGPTAAPTSDWAGPLKVAPWPLVACGRGPLQCWPMTERTHCLVTQCKVMVHSRQPFAKGCPSSHSVTRWGGGSPGRRLGSAFYLTRR